MAEAARIDPAQRALVGPLYDANDRAPKILILLASRNGAPWIREQLRSILSQRDVDIQVVVRDDASTDDTHLQIAPFLDDSRVRLISADSPSGSAAQNFFALIRDNPADGFEFVALADQDDEWFLQKLSRAATRLRAHSGAGYSSATLAVWPDGKSAVLTQSGRTSATDFLFGGIGQGCTFVLTADFYRRARAFLAGNVALARQIHYHDWALYALARTWGLGWTFDTAPSVRYRQHGGNDTGGKKGVRGVWKRLRLIRNGWYTGQLHAIARLCMAADPSNGAITSWHSTLSAPRAWSRRARILKFCARGGRRGAMDNCVVLLAAIAGWL